MRDDDGAKRDHFCLDRDMRQVLDSAGTGGCLECPWPPGCGGGTGKDERGTRIVTSGRPHASRGGALVVQPGFDVDGAGYSVAVDL